MRRNVVDVINKLKPVFEEQGISTHELDSIIKSKEFAPPELDHIHWSRLQNEVNDIANQHITDVTKFEQFPDWLKKISNIMMGVDGH